MEKINKTLELKRILDFISLNVREEFNELIKKRFNDLEEDIQNDFFTIVVLGEFKRGKSTFVNALIERKILPADVLPTTATINALMWSEEEKTYVVKNDGEIEEGNSTIDYLNKYVASEDFYVDDIKYLKIGCNAEILKDNLVIVDTPGVSDINEQRVQVTYNFIPRADAVVFLLDATSPLKRTEKEFIDEHLIKLGIDRVIFIANKFDNIDEEEEEEVLEDIEKRLKKAFNKNNEPLFKELVVLPMSSKMALEGIQSNDENLVNESGLKDVKRKLQKVIEEGTVGEEKYQRYRKRMLMLIESMERELENKIQLCKTDVVNLKKILENIDKMIEDEEKRKEKISEYIEMQKENILAMVKKSLNFFGKNLKDDVNEMIENYKGIDFKEYIEKQIPRVIKKSMNRWLSTYDIYINKLLQKLEKEVSQGLANYFKTRTSIQSNGVNESTNDRQVDNVLSVEAEDISSVTTKAGVISAGVTGIMMLVGGPILTPFITMAAYPVFQKKMLEKKLKEAKINVKGEVNEALRECTSRLSYEVIESINKRIENIKISTETTYNELFTAVRNKIQLEIDEKDKVKRRINEKVDELENQLMTLDKIKNKLLDEYYE